jgi:hypothetical protein
MASTEQDIRRRLGQEREGLADAVEELREEVGEATNVGAKLRSNLPAVAVGACGRGVVKAGGLRATARLLLKRR